MTVDFGIYPFTLAVPTSTSVTHKVAALADAGRSSSRDVLLPVRMALDQCLSINTVPSSSPGSPQVETLQKIETALVL